jgi:hypothetical protein
MGIKKIREFTCAPLQLWITREKLWIKASNWGEPVILSKNSPWGGSHIWGVI